MNAGRITGLRQGQRQVLIVTWLAYAGYHFCRVNFNLVQHAMGEEFGLGELAIGKILLAFTVCYIVGQLVSGPVCDRVGSHYMAATGAFGSAAMNALLPLCRTHLALVLVWGANGLFQSMGFSACIRALANWHPRRVRGRVNGIFALSYQFGNVVTWLVAAAVADVEFLCSYRVIMAAPS